MKIEKLSNCTLTEIKTRKNRISLTFTSKNKKYKLRFKGFIFITPLSPVGEIVKYVEFNSTFGFKAKSQIEFWKLSPAKYKHIYFKFDSPFNSDTKCELMGAAKNAKLTILK